MSTSFPFDRRVLEILHEIAAAIHRLESKMADVSTDVANLVAAVQSVTNDVTQVLQLIQSGPNLTGEQQQQLEDQINALQSLDTTLKAAASGQPPAPAPQQQTRR